VESNNKYKAQLAQAEAQSKLDDSSVAPLQHQILRLQTEIDEAQTHSTWLQNELRAKTEELSNLKVKQASEMAQLRGAADGAVSEKETLAIELSNLRRIVQDLQNKNGVLTREAYEAKQEAIDTKASMEEELVASRRLASLQKEQIDRLQQLYDGKEKQMLALKKMAQDAQKENEVEWEEHEREWREKSKRILDEQAAEYQQKIAELQERINNANRRVKLAEDGILAIEGPAGTSGRLALPSTGAAADENNEPMSLTDLYSKLADAEDALSAEVLRRKQAEIRFARLQGEIEAAAPKLIEQRKKYEMALKREEEFKQRTENALDDAAVARKEADMREKEMTRLQKKNKELEQETKELAKQVQEMLISRSTGVENPMVPQTVSQMQGANQRLLKDYAALTKENKELKEQLKADDKTQQIEDYKQELESLRNARKQQETFVNAIVQQRDLYRALVAKHDGNILGSEEEHSALEIVKQQSVRSKALEQECQRVSKELADTKAQIDRFCRDKEAAEERVQRFEAHNTELSSTVDRLTLELSQNKAAAARSEADANYQKEKVARLEESLQRVKGELNQVTTAKDRLMALNADLEQAISQANAAYSKMEAEHQRSISNLQLAQAQAESAKAAEKRIFDEATHLRSEISRQGAMIESIQRIESSLESRNNSEIESYKAEIISLREKLFGMEQKTGSDSEDLKGKIADQEIQIRELEAGRARDAKEALEAKNESINALKKVDEATKKAALLEAQLASAKKRLGDTTVDQDTEAEMRSKLASVSADLEAAKKQIETWKNRAATYEKLAKENEKNVAQMTEATTLGKQARDEEISKLKEELEQTNVEMAKRKEVITELANDLSNQRSEKEKAVNEVRQQVVALKAEVETYRETAEDAQTRYNEIFTEMNVIRAELAESQSNYERELALHAGARTDLRTAREECEKEVRARQAVEQEYARIKGELDVQHSLLEVEKSKREEVVETLEKRLSDTQAQNTVLHDQLEKIAMQVDKMQQSSSSDGAAGDEKESDLLGDNEMSSLRRTISELRELVKFVRSEKDAIQAQLDAARRATERERTKASIAQRSLEESRAELKVVQESSSAKAADANLLSERLKASEEQCRLLGDSNKHLQSQVLELQKKLANATENLEKSMKALKPAEKLQEELQADKAALLSEQESLKKEIEDWKKRVNSLVSKFNQIDPEEHKKLVKKSEELEKQVKDLQKKKSDAEDETKRIRTLASRASTQLTQNKQLVEDHKKTIAKLTSEKEALTKASKEGASKKEVSDLKDTVSKLEKERENEKIQLKGANEMNEKLRERLRQFQKTILTLQKKETTLNSQLAEARNKIGDQKGQDSSKEAPPSPAAAAASVVAASKEAKAETKATSAPAPKPATAQVAETAAKIETATPKVPPGGFKFGPSPTETKKAESVLSKKRPAEVTEEEQATTKKSKPQASLQAAAESGVKDDDDGKAEPLPSSPMPASSPTATPGRRNSSDRKELSMKEKLLEKKRKLLEQMKKAKEEKLKQGSVQTPASPSEPESKRAKRDDATNEEDSTISKDSALDPQAKEFIPTQAAPLSDSVDASVETKDEGEGDAEGGETKDEDGTADEGEVEQASASEKQDSAPAASLSAASVFGSGSGVIPTFGSTFGKGGSTPAFGQPLTFGSGMGFGSAASSSGTPFFGSSPKPGSGSAPLSGFGTTPSSGFGSSDSGTTPSSGFGSSSFLNMKPPGSSAVAPQFVFGKSSNIMLPTPSSVSPQASMFNAFSSPQPFGGVAGSSGQAPAGSSAKPLFAKEEEKVETKKEEEEDEEEGEVEDSEEK
jgi:nucleoprotein TPR